MWTAGLKYSIVKCSLQLTLHRRDERFTFWDLLLVLDKEECEGGVACRALVFVLDEEECEGGAACRVLLLVLEEEECEEGTFRGPALVVDEKVEIEGRAGGGSGGIR